MDQNKKEGLIWLIGPIVALFLGIVLFAIYGFVFQTIGQESKNPGFWDLAGTAVLMIVTLFCLLSALGVVVGIPMGIMHLRRSAGKK